MTLFGLGIAIYLIGLKAEVFLKTELKVLTREIFKEEINTNNILTMERYEELENRKNQMIKMNNKL